MRRGIQKILILLAVFIVALFTFSKLTNHETKDLTTDLAAPTLPVVYFEDNGHPLNELHGYVEEMSVISMRDTITPLPENGKLSLRIDPYDNKIKEVSFQIRSLNGDRLVQERPGVRRQNGGDRNHQRRKSVGRADGISADPAGDSRRADQLLLYENYGSRKESD